MNSVTIMGRLGRDPELRHTNSGKALTEFSLAVNRFGRDECDWIDCVAWEKTAESLCSYKQKGDLVAVEGRLQQDRWEQDGKRRSKIKVQARNVHFVSGGRQDGERREAPPKREAVPPEPDVDDIPF